ncbi:MAG: hypothetical protein ACQER4_07980, partial [Bacteroidota bacterium]
DLLERLFSEAQSGVLVTVPAADADQLIGWFNEAGVASKRLGKTGGEILEIDSRIRISVSELTNRYERVLPDAMNQV